MLKIKNNKFNDFEAEAMAHIIAEDKNLSSWLSRQYASAQVVSREFTGVGFFTEYEVSDISLKCPGDINCELGAIQANINGVQYGVGFVLFIRNGMITMLEGYTYGEDWPEVISEYSFILQPKIRAGIHFTGDSFSIDYVSHKLGVPASQWRAKEDWPDAIKNNPDLPEEYRPRTVWCLDTQKEESVAVCWQVEKIIEQLHGKEEIIKQLCTELNLRVSFTVTINMQIGNGPEMYLTREIIAFLAAINADIGFDMYAVAP